MEGGLKKRFGKIINCGKLSNIIGVKLPDMIFSINVFEKRLSINVLIEFPILVGCVIWGRNKCEDKESRNLFVEWWLWCFNKSTLKSPRRITNLSFEEILCTEH